MTTGLIQVAQVALKVPGLLVEIYGDIAKPGVRQVGKALDTVLGLGNTVLWPITWANERSRIYLEKNLQAYRERLEAIPEEKIISVPPEVGVPIAEKLAYVRDERLSELYVNLLAKASCEDTAGQAHPSFVNVINNLSPDEAQLLEFFVGSIDLIFVTAKWVDPKTNVFRFEGDLLLESDRLSALAYAENVPAYLNNLSGLGIVSIHHDRTVHNDAAYITLEAHWKASLPTSNSEYPEHILRFERGVVCRTDFGHQFIEACHQR